MTNDRHGWLILDKPLGISSAQAVGKVKRLLRPLKIGHGGTLDPLASGILPLALGEATKTFAYFLAHEKAYRFTLAFGEERSTDDLEGEVVATSAVRPTEAQLREALPQFIGKISQVPPVYSAIKVDGERAYVRARAGEVVEMQARFVDVYTLELKSYDGQQAVLEMRCGPGTYVRSLARDLSRALGSVGHVAALRRTGVGKFTESHAISLDSLEELVHSTAPLRLLSMAQVLDDIPALSLNACEVRALRQGQTANVPHLLPDETICLCLDEAGLEVAMGETVPGGVKTKRLFNLPT